LHTDYININLAPASKNIQLRIRNTSCFFKSSHNLFHYFPLLLKLEKFWKRWPWWKWRTKCTVTALCSFVASAIYELRTCRF